MPRRGQPRKVRIRPNRPRFERDLALARDHLPQSLGGGGMSVEQLSEKYGLHERNVYRVLAKPDIREIHNEWMRGVLQRHRDMGPAALEAMRDLIRQQDPYAVNQYWKRTGVRFKP